MAKADFCKTWFVAIGLVAAAVQLSAEAYPSMRYTKLAFSDDPNHYTQAPDYSPVLFSVPAFTHVELECVQPGVENPVWTKDGVPIEPADWHLRIEGRFVRILYFGPGDEGVYAVRGFKGSPARLKIEGNGGGEGLINSSSRARVEGTASVIHGFVVSGALPRSVLVRAVGPTLKGFGLSDVLLRPRLRLYDSRGHLLADSGSPDGAWPEAERANLFRMAGAFPLVPGSDDAALLKELHPGSYTAVVVDADGGGGDVLVETYLLPLSTGAPPSDP